MEKENSNPSQTSIAIMAHVSRVVTRVVDRMTGGDRVDFPLLVSVACTDALHCFGVEARVMYGQVAWIEIMEDYSPVWAGCWGENFHFWVATQFGEVVDLNTSVAYKKRSHMAPQARALYSPPMLWSIDVPLFYRYLPEGIAQLELVEEKDRKLYERVSSEVREKCQEAFLGDMTEEGAEFPNEAILRTGRQILDDSRDSFRHFDRALGVHGLPERAPI